MIITSLTLKNVMVHDAASFDFPPKGLVLVTGPNGSGKSTVVEAVAVALWGKTLRGTTAWREGVEGSVRLRFVAPSPGLINGTLFTVERARSKGGRQSLSVTEQVGAADPRVFENATKGKDSLESLVGDFAVWRRCAVFSSTDAAHFTAAPDAERKRLLETLLGLDLFQGALESCRADLKLVEEGDRLAELSYRETSGRADGIERALTQAKQGLQELAGTDGAGATSPEEIARLSALVLGAEKDLPGLRRSVSAGAIAGAQQDAAAREIRRRLERLRSALCPACSQPIPKSLVEGLERDAQQQEQEGERVRKEAHAQVEAARAEVEEVEESLGILRQRLAQAKAGALYASQRARFAETVASAEKTLFEVGAKLAGIGKQRQDYAEQLAELRAVEQILGLRGVRAHVLRGALESIETVANSWLERIAGRPMTLRLKPYKEKAAGGVTDAISLEVEGAGGGHGYKASSGGERRRIDIAILLALSMVAQAAYGYGYGTVFYDECFDALDADGIDAVATALREIARDQTVVVISHSPDLASRLKGDVHWQLERRAT